MLVSYRFADSTEKNRWSEWKQTDNMQKLLAEVKIALADGIGVDIKTHVFR